MFRSVQQKTNGLSGPGCCHPEQHKGSKNCSGKQ